MKAKTLFSTKKPLSTEEYLSKLVAMPTVSDDVVANQAAIRYIGDFFEKRGMYVQRFPLGSKEHTAIVASTRRNNAKTPTVLLAGHVDVVTAEPHMFTVRKEGGKYFGRGVYDMKCALASYMTIVDELQGSLADYDFAIMIVSDEEIAGRDGINTTTELIKMGYRPKFVILPDGGENWQLETLSNGYMHYTLQANGVTGHSSRPWLGENATEKLVDAIHELRAHFRDQNHETDTLNVAAVKTSEVPANQIPDHAMVDFSIRIRHKGGLEKWRKVIRKICDKHGIEATERAGWDVTYNDLENPYVRHYADLTQKVTGIQVTGFHSYAGSDARFFSEIGIPYANAYPKGGGHHSADEWLAEESLDQFKQIVRQYLDDMSKQPAK
jgi:succinyl-diaminopimelate desuccinylase